MVIAHNISALNTYKSLGIAGNQADNSMEKLSSGYKINKAADDAAGLSISEKMRSQIRGLNQASTNAENGVSMIQTAEGALNEEHSILQRMRELAVQAATDTNASEDREALQSEMAQLTSEINRIGSTTEFNGMKILNGTKAVQYTTTNAATSALGGLTYAFREGGVEGNDWSITVTKDSTDTTAASVAVSGKDVTITVGATNYTAEKVLTALQANDKTKGLFKVTGTGSLSASIAKTNLTGGTKTAGEDNSVYFHVGANSNQVINTEFNDMRANELGITMSTDSTAKYKYADLLTEEQSMWATSANVNNGTDTNNTEYSLNISSREGANNAIDVIDSAIKKVSNERSKYGAIQNRLEYTINNLNTTAENMTAAESTIRDVDMADEMMEYTKNNILQQAAQAMLVQANARPQQALQLLQ